MREEIQRAESPALRDFAAQGAVYNGLMRTLAEETFAHAYLISGLRGMGKRTLARLMAQYLLCGSKGEKPCGVCPACLRVRDDNHPDALVVEPGKPLSSETEAGRKTIPVDDIRVVTETLGRHTFEGGRRVVTIRQADRLTPGAQNALLKTLEEPPEGTVFLLTTDAPETLLPTIVSRCRAVKLHPWPDETVRRVLLARGVAGERAEQALRVCGGSIGRALDVAADEEYWQRRQDVMRDFFALESRSDILRVSSAWRERKESADELLDDVEDMVRTLLLTRLGRLEEEAVRQYPAAWQRLAKEAPLDNLTGLMDAVTEARRLKGNQVTWQAVVERLLLRLMEEKGKWSM